jgi:hypothetical protein
MTGQSLLLPITTLTEGLITRFSSVEEINDRFLWAIIFLIKNTAKYLSVVY